MLVAGCDHITTIHLDVAEGASIEWRETVVLGRHGETSGSALQRLAVDRGGRPLLRNEMPLGPRWPGALGPAGTDGARMVASTLVVGGTAPSDPADGAVLELTDDAWLVTRLGHDLIRATEGDDDRSRSDSGGTGGLVTNRTDRRAPGSTLASPRPGRGRTAAGWRAGTG